MTASWGQWGSIGSKKWVKTEKIYNVQKYEFSTTPRSSISTKIRLYGYGAKSQWGPPRVHLGANGVPLGPKNGSKPKKLTGLKIRIFDYPRSSISTQIRLYGYGAKSWWGHPRFHLGTNGDWVQKMGQNRKKLPCPKIRIFDYPAVIDFCQNSTLRFWRQITMGTPLGPSWGQWGSIGSKKLLNPSKITIPQISNFRLPRGHRFRPKFDIKVMAPNHGGDPLGSILGPMGSH